jgi:hypothetical protein
VIARNHHGSDARAPGTCDRVARLVARRIDHADQAQEGEILLDALVELLASDRVVRQQAKRDSKR